MVALEVETKPGCNSTFKQLPSNSQLAQFLSRHDDKPCGGFITRLDRAPVAHKRLTFAKAFILNVLVLCFLAGLSIITIAKGLNSPFPSSFRNSFRLTQDLVIASAATVLFRSTTIPFFWGECRLRLLHGFRPSEIVIRRPPVMTIKLGTSQQDDQRLERYWRMATRAVNPRTLYSNASGMLSSDYWIVEYAAVLDALARIAIGEFQEEDLEFAIWKQDHGVWSCCELWRMHEIMTDQQEIAMFKTFLTRAGKQELLSLWQEMMPTTHPVSGQATQRSSSPKAYQSMVDRFAQEGLDYETVWSEVSEKASLLSGLP